MLYPSFSEYSTQNGMNCYQFAIGFNKIVIVASEDDRVSEGSSPNFKWVKLTPGAYRTLYPTSQWPYSHPHQWSSVIEGCEADGLVDLKRHFRPVSGMRIVALYCNGYNNRYDSYYDFHFAYLNGEKWSYKFSSEKPRLESESNPDRPPDTIGRYKFDRFMLVPPTVTPHCICNIIHTFDVGSLDSNTKFVLLKADTEIEKNTHTRNIPSYDQKIRDKIPLP